MNVLNKNRLKLLAREVLDLFYPRDCLHSGEKLPSDSHYRYFSENSIHEIQFVKGPSCYTCGGPFSGEVIGDRICPSCKDLKPKFSQGKTAFMLKGAGRKLIHELKYHEGFHMWLDVAKLISQVPGYLEFIEGAVLVPVPLHWSKLRQRGFNQSLLLAKCLAQNASEARVGNILTRIKSTQTQTYLSKDERRKNVRNAFSLARKTAINTSLRYIIIDDVFTTGATLNACATVLKKNGAKQIDIVTLGHG